ncbi:MAG: hypothetical protein WKF40_11625 [Thermoleophilaceae bacterium]
MVLGILGLVICGLCAPFAWWQGRSAEAAIAASGGQYGGKGMATAGKILGIIGTVILVLAVIALIGSLVAGLALVGAPPPALPDRSGDVAAGSR